jgi:hypothetical protein
MENMMMKRTTILLIVTCMIFSVMISCAVQREQLQVFLITHRPYSERADTYNISYFMMHYILERIDVEFEYDYLTRPQAMVKIDAVVDAIIFPFVPPPLIAYVILLSDPFFTSYHKIFYDSRYFQYLVVYELRDLRPHVVGSHARYRHETDLRGAGLTVHYSSNNFESFKRLLEGRVSFVVENKIRGLKYINALESEDRHFIRYLDLNLFPEHFHVVTSIYAETAPTVIEKINEIIAEETFLNELVERFFSEVIGR